MSQESLWAVIGRSKLDGQFASSLFTDFDKAVKAGGYSLTDDEMKAAKAVFSERNKPSPNLPGPQDFADDFRFQQAKARQRLDAQVERIIELSKFTAKIFEDTISHAAGTYRTITHMNQVMFWLGVSFFVFSVIYGVITRNLNFTAAFAGLGATSFIGFFLLGPIKKTQAALSNLIQAEIAFMNYFEQISFWENYALIPRENTNMPNPLNIERASAMLQTRSLETIDILQKYLEDEKFDVKEVQNADTQKAASEPP